MSHKTEIVKQEQIGDERIAVTIRCCGDPKSDSTMTIAKAAGLSPGQLEAKVEAHHDAVARKHSAVNAASKHLQGIKIKTKEHDLRKI